MSDIELTAEKLEEIQQRYDDLLLELAGVSPNPEAYREVGRLLAYIPLLIDRIVELEADLESEHWAIVELQERS